MYTTITTESGKQYVIDLYFSNTFKGRGGWNINLKANWQGEKGATLTKSDAQINMKSLIKNIAGVKVALSYIGGNTFKLAADGGTFTKGKGGFYSQFADIKTAEVNDNELLITKAEIARLGTYMIYLNGKNTPLNLTGKWVNDNGVDIIISFPSTDLYYYFRRPDCGLVQVNNINGEHCRTEFHHQLGKMKNKFGEEIKVISK